MIQKKIVCRKCSLSSPRFLCKFALKRMISLLLFTDLYKLYLIGKGQKYPFKKIILAPGNPYYFAKK